MKREFSSIEIITTIVIVFILLGISFLWYLLFIKDSRNTVRLSDVNKIKESIETSLKISGVLPAPSDWVPITYLSWAVWIQWTFWDSVISKLSKSLGKKIVDPLTWNEYTYSLLNNNKEYQVRTMYEYEEKSVFNWISKTFATDEYSIVRWNFNWYLASVNKNNIIYVLSIPSIVINNLDDTSLSSIGINKKYIYDYNLWYNWFIPEKLELFSWSLAEFKNISNKAIFLNNYKQSYKNFPNKDKILLNLDKFNINIDNYDSDLDDIANNLLLRTVKDIPNKEFFLENEKRFVIDNFILDKVYEEVWEDKRNFWDRWWINSGAFFNVKDWIWSTIQGELEKWSKWQRDYEEYKWWLDTDQWFHPQNLFRLILNKKFKNFEQYTYFKINKYILSNSENRYESNWFLLFNRYLDSDNLYYAWIRVDWAAVIKKKYKWEYYTLAYEKIFDWKYDRVKSPNLIPINKWIWIKTEVLNFWTDNVSIKLFIDTNNDWKWTYALGVSDKSKSSLEKVINDCWYAWVRTDFMDVDINKYYIKEI